MGNLPWTEIGVRCGGLFPLRPKSSAESYIVVGQMFDVRIGGTPDRGACDEGWKYFSKREVEYESNPLLASLLLDRVAVILALWRSPALAPPGPTFHLLPRVDALWYQRFSPSLRAQLPAGAIQ